MRGDEPVVIINGQQLSTGQAMTVRVALANFYGEMHEKKFPLGKDEHGIAMRDGYRARLEELFEFMSRNQGD